MAYLFNRLFRSEAMCEVFFPIAAICRACSISRPRWAQAQARLGVIPKAGGRGDRGNNAGRICSASRRSPAAPRPAGNTAIPLVKALTALVAKTNKRAIGLLCNWGATSQDAMDTGADLAAALRVSTSSKPT